MRSDRPKRSMLPKFGNATRPSGGPVVRGGPAGSRCRSGPPVPVQRGVVRVLAAWRLYCESLEGPLPDDGLVLVSPKGRRIGGCGAHCYRRTGRTFAELGFGALLPMGDLIPELAPFLAPLPAERSAGQAEGTARSAGERFAGASPPHHIGPAAGPIAGDGVLTPAASDTAPRALVGVPARQWVRRDRGRGFIANRPWGALERPQGACA